MPDQTKETRFRSHTFLPKELKSQNILPSRTDCQAELPDQCLTTGFFLLAEAAFCVLEASQSKNLHR